MAFDTLAAVPGGGLSMEPPEPMEIKTTYKSYRFGQTPGVCRRKWMLTRSAYRKKFRKMKLKFDHVMRESESLFKEERRANETVRRLAQENEYFTVPMLCITWFEC
jgi:IEC3 subunit of the Ino80 complex, chromatin re-modelling